MPPMILKNNEPVGLRKIRKTSAATPSIVTLDLRWTTNTDVDLAMMVEFRGGRTRVIQALDRDFGSLTGPPYISLSGDDRHGGHEQLQLDLANMDDVVRAMAFAYIYQGGNWRSVGDARVEVHHPQLGDFVIQLDRNRATSCALVDFRSDGEGGLVMTRLAEFIHGYHQDIDRHYGWPNINWTVGTKD